MDGRGVVWTRRTTEEDEISEARGRHQTRPRSFRWAWVPWLTTVALFAATWVMVRTNEGAADTSDDWTVLLIISVFVMSYSTIGALISSRDPRNPLGWFAAGCGLMYALASFSLLYAEEGLTTDLRPGGAVLLALSQWQWLAAIILGGPLLILYFPRGRLPARIWGFAAGALGVGLISLIAALTFTPGLVPDSPVENPFAIEGTEGFFNGLELFSAALLVMGSVLSIASIVARFRHADVRERQQLKWFLFSLAAAVTLVIGVSLPLEALGYGELSNLVVTGSLTIIPISIGVAVLTRRLYDIDVVINRALVYGGLTAFLGLCYVALVVLLQAASSGITPDSDLAVAASTLAVAGLFGPARARMQGFIDRRFYRRKYDATKTLGAFSAGLRNEVELDALNTELVAVVQQTMRPTHVSVWLRDHASAPAKAAR
jgi:hypothetical protein